MRRKYLERTAYQWLHRVIRSDTVAQFFQFEVLKTSYQTEILAGITTFMTVAPLLTVNAHILSNAIFLERAGD